MVCKGVCNSFASQIIVHFRSVHPAVSAYSANENPIYKAASKYLKPGLPYNYMTLILVEVGLRLIAS